MDSPAIALVRLVVGDVEPRWSAAIVLYERELLDCCPACDAGGLVIACDSCRALKALLFLQSSMLHPRSARLDLIVRLAELVEVGLEKHCDRSSSAVAESRMPISTPDESLRRGAAAHIKPSSYTNTLSSTPIRTTSFTC